MTAECTTNDCGNWTDQYICPRCIEDLQAWIDQIPALIPELDVTIAKLDKTRPTNMGGSGGGKPGSAAPTNLDASQIKANLESVHDNAAYYAPDKHAAGIATIITEWVTKAERLISGPEAEHVDHAAVKRRVQNIAPPMPTRQLLPWLREKAGLHLTSQIIRHYAHKGYIHPVQRDPLPTYYPHEILAAYNQRGKEVA